MQTKIFYSWQSDLPNSTNRGFIEAALRKAADSIAKDSTVEIEPVIERDTQGVGGSPDISKTILEKIESSQIFLADVSIITKKSNKDRPCPNPNVLIELGYAMRNMGASQIILVMNKKYGGPELLPFDLKMKRVLVYEAEESSDKNEAKKALEKSLESQIRLILPSISLAQIPDDFLRETIEGIESQAVNRIKLVRNCTDKLLAEFDPFNPGSALNDDDYDEVLIERLAQTKTTIKKFADLYEAIGLMNDKDALSELLDRFKTLLEKSYQDIGFEGTYDKRSWDYYRFLGNELFIGLIQSLLKEKRWSLIKNAFDHKWMIDNAFGRERRTLNYEYFCLDTMSFDVRKNRLKLNRVSIHADLLKERHTSEPLNKPFPFEEFMEADYFIFLRSEGNSEKPVWRWIPRSTIYMNRVPGFFISAHDKTYAAELSDALDFQNIETLKEVITSSGQRMQRIWNSSAWRYPILEDDIKLIGSS